LCKRGLLLLLLLWAEETAGGVGVIMVVRAEGIKVGGLLQGEAESRR
jgi:hypothetical protein